MVTLRCYEVLALPLWNNWSFWWIVEKSGRDKNQCEVRNLSLDQVAKEFVLAKIGFADEFDVLVFVQITQQSHSKVKKLEGFGVERGKSH